MPTLTARVKDALSTADEIGVDPVRFSFGAARASRGLLIARSAPCDVRWIAAAFVGADGTEKRCSATSCRSVARTSRIGNFVVTRSCNLPLINWP